MSLISIVPNMFEPLTFDCILFPGPEVIKLFSCSAQLSMIFHLVIKIKIPTIKTFFMLNSAEHAQLS